MTELGMTQRHGRLLTVLSLLLGLTACGSLPDEVTDVNGVPCMTFRKTHAPKRICAANPAPSAEVAREIKTFAPDPASAQVLVKLLDRAGATRALSLRVNGQAVADLVPGGLVRLRLSPGEHELAVAWGNQQATLSVQVRAGDVQFAEVGGRFRFWDIGFGWNAPDPEGARERAASARVTADVDLRAKSANVSGSVTATR
jgi:hypothetical protein